MTAKAWRLAKALDVLRSQVNTAFPHRRKQNDGTIGDAAHATRASDHNPWVDDGVVTALDITHDPANGCDCHLLSELLLRSRDPRIKYIIWNKRIANQKARDDYPPFAWRPYSGASDHTEHMHVSVLAAKIFYDCEQLWTIAPQHKPPVEIAAGDHRSDFIFPGVTPPKA